jgi:hypothetical protein
MTNDTFRREYKKLTPAQQTQMDDIKMAAEYLLSLIDLTPPTEGRSRALAITKLEECVFWAVKGATA